MWIKVGTYATQRSFRALDRRFQIFKVLYWPCRFSDDVFSHRAHIPFLNRIINLCSTGLDPTTLELKGGVTTPPDTNRLFCTMKKCSMYQAFCFNFYYALQPKSKISSWRRLCLYNFDVFQSTVNCLPNAAINL